MAKAIISHTMDHSSTPTSVSASFSSLPAGATIMETNLAIPKRTCICKSKSCKQLTKCFQSISDIRGRYFTMPCLDATRNGGVKVFKFERMCHHLNIADEDMAFASSSDKRDQGKNGRKGKRSHRHNIIITIHKY